MNDEKDPCSSAEQDSWVDLAQRAQIKLGEMINTIPAMKPEEAKELMLALNQCYWFHMNAITWDHRLQLEMTRLMPE